MFYVQKVINSKYAFSEAITFFQSMCAPKSMLRTD